MKSPIFNETPLVLLASKLTGRPVKWISTRTEAFLSDAQARDNVTEAELALDKNGIFIAFHVKTFAAIGAYLQHSMPAFVLNAGTLAGVYRTPAMHVDITAVFSNTNPMRPYRGNGRPEAAYVIERMILDHIERAKRMGLPYVYLGYWVPGSRKMDYKGRFLPQERLMPSGWSRVER